MGKNELDKIRMSIVKYKNGTSVGASFEHWLKTFQVLQRGNTKKTHIVNCLSLLTSLQNKPSSGVKIVSYVDSGVM